MKERLRLAIRSPFLHLYAGALTVVPCAVVLLAAQRPTPTATFKEITVERINVIEPNGKKRLVLSNSSLLPPIITATGEAKTRAVQGQGGMLFYDNDGTEAGGLTLRSRVKPNGEVYSTSGLALDERGEDQTLVLEYEQNGKNKVAGLRIWDYVANGPEESTSPASRVFVGRHGNGDARVLLSDGRGRARLRLSVTAGGQAVIDFLSEQGEVVRRVGPDTTPSKP